MSQSYDESPIQEPPIATPRWRGDETDSEALFQRVYDIVSEARPMPFSSSVKLEREELLELLQEGLNRFPEEIRRARFVLRESADIRAKGQREADEIIDEARVRAAHMVERTEIARLAEQHAERTVEAGRAEARRLRHEADDYCDQKLASFEIVLERTMKTVQAGRRKLQDSTQTPVAKQSSLPEDNSFFDQERAD